MQSIKYCVKSTLNHLRIARLVWYLPPLLQLAREGQSIHTKYHKTGLEPMKPNLSAQIAARRASHQLNLPISRIYPIHPLLLLGPDSYKSPSSNSFYDMVEICKPQTVPQ